MAEDKKADLLNMDASAWADEICAEHVAAFKADPKHEVYQTLYFYDPRVKAFAIVPCGWANSAERALVLALLRVLLAESGATQYAFTSEVWISKPRLGKLPPGFQPRHDPDRKEMVFTVVITKGDPTPVTRAQQITRDAQGGVTALTPYDEKDAPTNFGGELLELFGDRLKIRPADFADASANVVRGTRH